MVAEWALRGERRVEADAKLSGKTKYSSDIIEMNALEVAFHYSAEPHAQILRVDVTEALALPGVAAAITGPEIGIRRYGRAIRDYPVLAVDRVLFIGQRVAAVAAVDRQTAEQAAALIEVEYEPLPTVTDVDAAMDPASPTLHPDYAMYTGAVVPQVHRNAQGNARLVEGDAFADMDTCDFVFDHTYRLGRSHAAPLEPHACLVSAGQDKVTVYSSHKEPFNLRRNLAYLTGRAEGDFAIEPITIGGDFGGKASPFAEATCYFLSAKTGRAARHVMSYYEELTTTSARHSGQIRIRSGVRNGRLSAHICECVLDGGAFGAIKPIQSLVVPINGNALGAYDVPNRSETTTVMYTNNIPGGHVRAPGEFQAVFAGETHIDIIARELGEDPVAFRLRNAADPTVRKLLGEIALPVEDWRRCLGPDEGVGVSVFHRDAGGGHSEVLCTASRGARVEFRLNVPDQGSGTYTAVRRIAARALGVGEEVITVFPVGTDAELPDNGSGASRVTAIVGRATVDACTKLMAELGHIPGEQRDENWIEQTLAAQSLTRVQVRGSCIRGRPKRGEAERSQGALAVQVRVDKATGAFAVQRALLVVDTGTVLNPVAHRGQLEGGFVYGLSQGLMEELCSEDGQIITASLGDYKLATAYDIPPLEVRVLQDTDEPGELFGIRSVGELSNLGVAPAVANAIADAIAARVFELPVTAERVWQAAMNSRMAE